MSGAMTEEEFDCVCGETYPVPRGSKPIRCLRCGTPWGPEDFKTPPTPDAEGQGDE